ncbi:uracil-DNA glycosylase family protein [bacterium]|nr:uracil-DNA glycosylase family protein [bacterium]
MMDSLLKKIRQCTLCEKHLPFDPKPILSFSKNSKILICGQAPGTKAHDSSTPWNDASGERLRHWLGVTKEEFYNDSLFAIVPMGFCYPGKGKSGDLPPRPECAEKWMATVLDRLSNVKLTILIGAYSQGHFLKTASGDLTDTVKRWKQYSPHQFPLPHPSPRNNIWLKKNPWFEKDLVPKLRREVRRVLK